MNRSQNRLRQIAGVIFLTFLISTLTACDGQSEDAAPTPVIIDDFVSRVSVTGELVPETWAVVGTMTGGMISEIAVGEGERVTTAEILIRLDDADAEAALAEAKAALLQAEAELLRISSPPSVEEVAVVEAQVRSAQAAVTQTLRRRDQIWAGQYEAELKAAEAEIAAAQAEQLVARQEHDDTMKCYEVEQPDGTEKEVCPTLGTFEERARFTLQAANEQVEAAEARKEALQSQQWAEAQIAEATIAAAERQLEITVAELARLEAGASESDIAVAEAAVAQAEAAVATAQLNLDRSVIRAPFDGTVGAVNVRVGEFVPPSTALVTLGDLSTLRVETTDLDEIDVARIAEGQTAVVTFDALPDRTFTGTVTHIAPMASTTGGGVNYRVVVELDELDPALRWGMTAFVDIETGE
jgi:multidrug efflux pump subunit AcrA (membrane-fusion protein)